ncbi:hypothetical protein L873DRAFT_1804263 [Choiromyces venosus 120613-1]|uniref:Uncharacterized protein n=1 Tax=Choiromyces venosus 120613-1 TaxID=1336337 RepID=A0A3N4K4V9_9PEZI|nr:hypothetical protein L873DRAFT_1804263 [Choiromyces venosus 120613-1]
MGLLAPNWLTDHAFVFLALMSWLYNLSTTRVKMLFGARIDTWTICNDITTLLEGRGRLKPVNFHFKGCRVRDDERWAPSKTV